MQVRMIILVYYASDTSTLVNGVPVTAEVELIFCQADAVADFFSSPTSTAKENRRHNSIPIAAVTIEMILFYLPHPHQDYRLVRLCQCAVEVFPHHCTSEMMVLNDYFVNGPYYSNVYII